MPRIVSSTASSDIMAIGSFPVKKAQGASLSQDIPPIMDSLARIDVRSVKMKPSYADTWVFGTSDDLNVTEEYETEEANITIGTADDGEIEYNIVPNEYSYPQELDSIVNETISYLRKEYRKTGGRMDRGRAVALAENHLWEKEYEISQIISKECSLKDAVTELSEVAYRYTIGKGIFDILLADQRLEDIYVDAPCEKNRIHVTLNSVGDSNSHVRCRTNLVCEPREMRNIITLLMRESALPFCESNPVLETDMGDSDARATVVGYPMSPNGDSLAIRKHSRIPWTLTRLIGNGTIDANTAGVLSYLVDNRSTILVSGARGSGKSSLLSALMFEFPVSQRILTIEDTLELPGKKMRSLGYKVQSMLIDDRNGEAAEKRADDALRVSLRLGESAIILGEVRGEEAKTLYQSMSTGRAGSSIMGTIHGDCAQTVFNRVVKDLMVPPESFMETDFIITMGTMKDRGTNRQIRKVNEFVATGSKPGDFIDVSDGKGLSKCGAIKRIVKDNNISIAEAQNEILIRARQREFLVDMAKTKGDGFYGPEWIIFANDHLNKCILSGMTDADEVLKSFKERFNEFTGEEE